MQKEDVTELWSQLIQSGKVTPDSKCPVDEILRLFSQLTNGEGIAAPISPRCAVAIIKQIIGIESGLKARLVLRGIKLSRIPDASDELIRRYESNVQNGQRSSGNVAQRTPQRGIFEEDLSEGNIGINKYGSSFE